LHIARYSAVEFHVWNSTSKDPWTAKEMVLDMDPGSGITKKALSEASLKVKNMLDALDLVSFPKTTGKKGLHIHLPLVPEYSVDQVYQLSKSIAYILEEEAPHLFTSSSKIKDRKNKIYIDYMRNAFGATFIAPYSPRAISEAYIALPIDWKELENSEELPRLTLKEVFESPTSSIWEGYWNHAQEIELFKKE